MEEKSEAANLIRSTWTRHQIDDSMKIFHWAQNDTELLKGTDDSMIPQIK